MSDFSNRVDLLLAEKSLKRADLVRGTGIPEGTIRNWARFNPSSEAARKVAEFFGVSLSWLLFGEEEKTPEDITAEEFEFLKTFRTLSPKDKYIFKSLLQIWKEPEKMKEKDSLSFLIESIIYKVYPPECSQKNDEKSTL